MKQILIVLTLPALIFSCKGQNNTTSSLETAMVNTERAEVIPGFDMPEWTIDTDVFNWSSDTKPAKPIAFVRQMVADKDGNIWFASWNGIVRYNTAFEKNHCNSNSCGHDIRYVSHYIAHKKETDKLITRFTEFDSLQFFHPLCVFRDSKDNIWFGTRYHGVFRYNGSEFQQFDQNSGLGENHVICINEDREGRIWFGTTNGLSMYDEKAVSEGRPAIANYNKENGLPDNMVLALLYDIGDNRLYIGTQGGLCYFDASLPDMQGKMFSNVNICNEKPFLYVETLFLDSGNTIWIGHSEGLTSFNGTTFHTLTTKDGLPDNFVGSMVETKENGNSVYWLGIRDSYGRGMGICSFDGKKFSYLTEKDGLPNNRILNMINGPDGNIWMGASDGVSRFDGLKFKIIAREDGC